MAAGQYVAFQAFVQSPGAPGLTAVGELINQKTGTRTAINPPGCHAVAGLILGGPWLTADCRTTAVPSPMLSELTRKRWSAVPLARTGFPNGCALTAVAGDDGECGAVGVGRYWLELEETCYHCADAFGLQPIGSAAWIRRKRLGWRD